jgi:hypothetical protein
MVKIEKKKTNKQTKTTTKKALDLPSTTSA